MKITGKLKNGFEYEYDDKVFHSYRFVMAVRDTMKPDKGYAVVDMLERILGEEQHEQLLEYMESKGIEVTVELMGDIVGELTENAGDDIKNS